MTTQEITMRLSRLISEVDAEARTLKPGAAALTVVVAPFFALGWLVGLVARAAWFVVAFAWTASVVGFRTARPKTRGL